MKRCALILFLLALAAPALAVWPPPIRLTDGPNQNINPFLSMQDYEYPIYDDICLVWQRSRTGGWDIYSRMTNGLDTLWASPVLVSSLADSNLTPASANYGQRRYCVWVNCHRDSQNVLCSRWTGSAWGPAMYVTQDAFPNSGPAVWCHRTADTTWVAWASYRSGSWNLYSRFYDGSSWSPEIPVVENLGNNRFPRLFKLPGFNSPPQYLSLVWQSDAFGNSDILLSRYQGGAWSAPIHVTTGPQSDIQPSPVRGFIQQGLQYRVTLVWASDSLGNYEGWGTSTDSLISRERMTDHSAVDNEPSSVDCFFIVDDKRLNHPWLTAWMSDRDGNHNIYAEYAYGIDVVDTNSFDDLHPQTAAVGLGKGTLRSWIVWQSNRDGNWNLYGSNRLIFWDAIEEKASSLSTGKVEGFLYPTPYSPGNSLVLSLPQAGMQVVLNFYDLKGGLVSRQVAVRKASGLYQATWDGRDASGKPLPSGLYFLKAEGTAALFRIVLLR
jgi:hypothetical protein